MFLYLFVCIDPHGDGWLSRTRRFLFIKVPAALEMWGKFVLGETITRYIKRFWLYLWYEKNPSVQIFYLLLMNIGYYYYYYHGLVKLVPNMYISEIHLYTVHASYIACMLIFLIASRSEPGKITRKNVDRYLRKYQPDTVIYKKKDNCKFCNFQKVPRSKHCRLCDVCIPRFDHHCIWINNGVGEKNYKYFYIFLVVHLIYCVYALIIGACSLYAFVVEKNLMNAIFENVATGK